MPKKVGQEYGRRKYLYLLIINLVGYCNGKHPVNYVRIGAYEVLGFDDDGWDVGGVREE